MKRIGETDYFIDTLGRVFKNGKQLKTWKHKGRNSTYERISLTINGKRRGHRVHRLVAQAFIDNPENKPEVHHLDGNTFNNNVTNLIWVTKLENEKFKK